MPGGEMAEVLPDDTARAADFVSRFEEAFRARSASALAGLCHDDCEVHYPTSNRPLNRADLEAYWSTTLALAPDVKSTVVNWASKGDVVFIEWEATGKVAGRHMTWRGVDRMTLRDGLVEDEGS